MKKRFKEDAKVGRVRVQYNLFPAKVRYRLFNGRILIDLKKIIDGILEEQGISNYDTNNIDLAIPFDMEKVVSDNCIVMIIDKKRYTLRLKDVGIVVNKQQKIDYDNTHPHRWKKPQWLKFIESLHFQYYGFSSLELNRQGNRGQHFGLLNNIFKKIVEDNSAFEADAKDVKDYLQWAYEKKSHKISLNMKLLQSDYMIQEWFVHRKKYGSTPDEKRKKKKRKWD